MTDSASGAGRAPRGRVRRQRGVTESVGSIVLGFESVIVFLGGLVIYGLRALPPGPAIGGGTVVAVLMIVTSGLLRHRWGFVVGWILQAVVLASGFLVVGLFVVGAVFTAIWAYALIAGSRIERRQRAYLADHPTEGDIA